MGSPQFPTYSRRAFPLPRVPLLGMHYALDICFKMEPLSPSWSTARSILGVEIGSSAV